MGVRRLHPGEVEGLVAFWDFGGGGGGVHEPAAGKGELGLEEREGPLERVEGGVFGRGCVRVRFGQWLRVPRGRLGGLDVCGRQPVTVVAWVCPDSERLWQFVAGVWNERDHKRQYALFYNGAWQYELGRRERVACARRVHAYGSREGGHTPGDVACFSYATGGSEVVPGRWCCLGMSWDGEWLCAWVNGGVDGNGAANPLRFEGPLFDGGEDGADFTVAQRAMAGWKGYPEERMPVEEGFSGLLGGVAVFGRALGEEEMRGLAGWVEGAAGL